MLIKSEYLVNFPVEHFTEWMKERAMSDGIISENSNFEIRNVSYDVDNKYVVVDGNIWTTIDS